jgi:hypothetical protein
MRKSKEELLLAQEENYALFELLDEKVKLIQRPRERRARRAIPRADPTPATDRCLVTLIALLFLAFALWFCDWHWHRH